MIEINLPNRAAAQTTLAYNSACMFDGVPLGATSAGLYRVVGYTDHGTAIPALVKSGLLNLGLENKKRFRFFYFGIEASGPLTLTVHGDGVLAGRYTVSGLQPGLQVVRVPISREVNAWYWQWTVENSAGSFFVLHSVQALPVILHPGHQ